MIQYQVNWLEAFKVLDAIRYDKLEGNCGYRLGERADLFCDTKSFASCLAPEGWLFFPLDENVPIVDKLLISNYICSENKKLRLTSRGFDTWQTLAQYIKDKGEDSLSKLFVDEITWEAYSLYGSNQH